MRGRNCDSTTAPIHVAPAILPARSIQLGSGRHRLLRTSTAQPPSTADPTSAWYTKSYATFRGEEKRTHMGMIHVASMAMASVATAQATAPRLTEHTPKVRPGLAEAREQERDRPGREQG
jgi:hypothetical protein